MSFFSFNRNFGYDIYTIDFQENIFAALAVGNGRKRFIPSLLLKIIYVRIYMSFWIREWFNVMEGK
jgi:hypothetical protein